MLFRTRSRIVPLSLPAIERVDSVIVLGVNISYIWASPRIDRLLRTYTSSLHALRILRAHGLWQIYTLYLMWPELLFCPDCSVPLHTGRECHLLMYL